jgi:hypothetical protein
MATRHDEGSLMQKLTAFVIRLIFRFSDDIYSTDTVNSFTRYIGDQSARASFRGDSYRLTAHDNSHTFW